MQDSGAITKEITAPLLRLLKAGRSGFVLVSHRQREIPERVVEACREAFVDEGFDVHNVDFGELGPNPVEDLVRRHREAEGGVFFIRLSRNSLNPYNTAAVDAVRALNLHRDVFKTEKVTAVLWVHVVDLAMLHEKASNFLEFRVRAVELEPETTSDEPKDEKSAQLPNNLPFPSLGPAFVGREKELDELGRLLGDHGKAAIAQTIKGLGGVGKTRLAVEFAWRHRDDYSALLFARADAPNVLGVNVARLAAVLGLPECTATEEPVQFDAVRRWLDTHDRWLLILDNADDDRASEAVEEFARGLERGFIITTSRFQSWQSPFGQSALTTLNTETAKDYFLGQTHERRVRRTDDDLYAAKIAGRLDSLPLAVEQAAAYINQKRISFEEYLRLWESEQSKLMYFQSAKEMRHYDLSVGVTLATTVDRLGVYDQALLRLLSYCAPDPLPESMILEGGKHIETAADLLRQEIGETDADGESEKDNPSRALEQLTKYSLIEYQSGKNPRLHRLVAEVIRDRIPEEDKCRWVECALKMVADAAPSEIHSDDVRVWPVWDLLRPHAEALAMHGGNCRIGEPTRQLMNELGRLKRAKAIFKEGET